MTPRHGHAPVTMQRRETGSDTEGIGDFAWVISEDGVRRIVLMVPGCDGVDDPTRILLPVARERQPGKAWGWDGNEDHLTLMPSVHTKGHWHGWVRDGQLVEA